MGNEQSANSGARIAVVCSSPTHAPLPPPEARRPRRRQGRRRPDHRRGRARGRPHHETILFDMPATGHALAMTELPDLLLRLIPRGPIAAALREGQTVMYDPERTTALVVTLAEALPVTESLELIAGLRRTR